MKVIPEDSGTGPGRSGIIGLANSPHSGLLVRDHDDFDLPNSPGSSIERSFGSEHL